MHCTNSRKLLKEPAAVFYLLTECVQVMPIFLKDIFAKNQHMKHLILSLFAFCSLTAFSQQKIFDGLVKDVNVIDVQSGKIIPHQNIYTLSGKIVLISSGTASKKIQAKQTVNGTGKYLMPGMYDMHVHFPENDPERFFQLQTLAGITASRIMKSTDATLPFAATHSTDGSPKLYAAYNFYSSKVYTQQQIKDAVDSAKLQGYSLIKIFGLKSPVYFDWIMDAAAKNNLPVCGHALNNIKPKKLIKAGYRSIEHLGYFDKAATPAALDSLIDLAAANNTFMCPTLDWTMMVYHSVPQDSLQYRAGYAFGTALYKTSWDTLYTNTSKQLGDKAKQYAALLRDDVNKKIAILAKMRAKRIPVIAGSDAEEPYQVPGFSLIEELKLIKRAGYSNDELLRMVTVNAAAFFSKTASVHKGDDVNFILLSENPRENIANLESVEYIFENGNITDAALLRKTIK